MADSLRRFIDDVITVVFERNPTRFLKTHLIPVDGTEQAVVGFGFDDTAFKIAFDAELTAALRTRGLEHPRRDDVVISHGSLS
jgi:hypothetical protein